MYLLLFIVLHWYLSLFFQSFFHHRYAAHRQFTMSKTWERIFYVCCFITQGSSYISAYAYSVMHRLHHEHADTDKDPHSPFFVSGVIGTLLQTRNSYSAIHTGKVKFDDKYDKDIPHWDDFDRIAHHWITRVVWMGIYVFIYIQLATAWWMYLFLPFTIMICSVQGFAINWWAHKFGYVNHATGNRSRNIIPFDIIFWGEGYHNNHHKYPGRANYATKWYEFDMGYACIRVMNRLGIVRLRNE